MKALTLVLTFVFLNRAQAQTASSLSCHSLQSQKNLQKIEMKMSSGSEALAAQLKAQGFRCDSPPPSFERGYRCRGMIEGYPQSVNIFIPPHFEKRKSQPLALHFHGHNQNPQDPEVHFNVKNGDGDYGKMLALSGANTLLIIPESLGKDSTYKDYFKKTEDLDRLLKGVESKTGTTISSLSLSSHSGGDRTMDRLASWYISGHKGDYLGKTQSIALFDSLYGQREALARWPQALKEVSSQSRFLGSYVVGPADSTSRHMKWFKTKVPTTDQWKYREVKTSHMSIMRDGGFSDYLRETCAP